jgi:hypothetical protein
MPVMAMTSEPAMTRKRFIIRSQESGVRSQESGVRSQEGCPARAGATSAMAANGVRYFIFIASKIWMFFWCWPRPPRKFPRLSDTATMDRARCPSLA